jgi:hypothetical protein
MEDDINQSIPSDFHVLSIGKGLLTSNLNHMFAFENAFAKNVVFSQAHNLSQES